MDQIRDSWDRVQAKAKERAGTGFFFDLQQFALAANPQYDQLSTVLAETCRDVVDDNVFVSNTVMERSWEQAEQVAPGRFFMVPIVTGKNQNATAVGMYDEVPASPQTVFSAASYPWSFYVVSIQESYHEVAVNRGINQRVDLVGGQVDVAIESLADLVGNDITNTTKGTATPNAVSAYGVLEASDDGTVTNVYGNITRTGGGAFTNWQGNDIRKLTTANIGTATNDCPISQFYNLYNLCTQGMQTPTEIYSTKNGIGSYAFALQTQQRFAAGEVANAGFAGVAFMSAIMLADEHFTPPTNGSSTGANFYAMNKRHQRFFYFGRKGVEFIDWIDSPAGALSKIARYVVAFQYASSQCRVSGQLLNVNVLGNL